MYFIDDNGQDKSAEDQVKVGLDAFFNMASDRTPIEERWFRNEKLMIRYLDPATWPYNSRISAGKTPEFVTCEHANLYQATMIQPPFQVLPFGGEDVAGARLVKKLMLWQWETMNGFYSSFKREWDRMILISLVYGWAPWVMDWQRNFGWVPGPGGKSIQKMIYSGVGFRSLSPYQFYTLGGASRIYESELFARRLLLKYQQLKDLEKRDQLVDVDRVKGKEGKTWISQDYDGRVNELLKRSYSNYTWTSYDKNADIECIEIWAPYENRRALIAAGDVLLTPKDAKIPFLNSEVPFGSHDNIMSMWGQIGFSTPELLEDLDIEASMIKCALIDNMNKQLMPQFMRLRAANIFDEDLSWEPFGYIDTNDVNGLQQLKVYDTWSQPARLEEAAVDAQCEARLGLLGLRRGVTPASRETGYSVAQRAEASSVVFGKKVQYLLETMTIILGKQNRLNRQFMRTEDLERLIPGGIPGYLSQNADEVLRDYDFICVPTASFGNRSLRKEEWIKLATLYASVPQLAAVTEWAEIADQIYEEWDVRNREKLVIRGQQAQAQAVGMGAGGGGASPGPGPQGGGIPVPMGAGAPGAVMQ